MSFSAASKLQSNINSYILLPSFTDAIREGNFFFFIHGGVYSSGFTQREIIFSSFYFHKKICFISGWLQSSSHKAFPPPSRPSNQTPVRKNKSLFICITLLHDNENGRAQFHFSSFYLDITDAAAAVNT